MSRATTATPRRPKMGRKRTPPPPRQPGDPWHIKLARLVNAYHDREDTTDAALAASVGWPPSKLSRILAGESNATMDDVATLLAAIGSDFCKLHRA